MPLRDHFRSPLDDKHSWDELHGGWPMVMVQQLVELLPEPYFAAPGVHLGSLYEVDVGTYRDLESHPESDIEGNGGLALATYAPPKPTITLEPELPEQDLYEVRIYDSRRNRRLIAAVELVSPSNKDRPERRDTFVAKVATLLKNDICVTIVDIVSTLNFNLYAKLLEAVQGVDPTPGDDPPPMYAVTLRTRYEDRRKMMDNWYHPLAIGQTLPTLPIWLREKFAVSLDLESSYEKTCSSLRIR